MSKCEKCGQKDTFDEWWACGECTELVPKGAITQARRDAFRDGALYMAHYEDDEHPERRDLNTATYDYLKEKEPK